LGLFLEVSLEASIGDQKLRVKTSLSAMGTSAVQFWRQSLKAELIRTLRAHALFIVLVLFYGCATLIVAQIYDVPDKAALSLYSETLFVMTALFAWASFLMYVARLMLFVRPEHLTRRILNDLRRNYLTA